LKVENILEFEFIEDDEIKTQQVNQEKLLDQSIQEILSPRDQGSLTKRRDNLNEIDDDISLKENEPDLSFINRAEFNPILGYKMN